MRTRPFAAVLLSSLLAVPALSSASILQSTSTSSGRSGSQTAKPAPPKPAAVVHSTKGVVKSVDDTSMVVTLPTGKTKEMTFVLNPSTERKGTVAVGATVQVRYKTEGTQQVATAISVQPHK
jgi:hypothetical protein